MKVFETIRVEGGRPELLGPHLQRLHEQCQQAGLPVPSITTEDVAHFLHTQGALRGIWRLNIIAPEGELRLAPYNPPLSHPWSLCLYSRLMSYDHAHLKCWKDPQRIAIKTYAVSRGYDDAITLSPEGYLLEASYANLFWKAGNQLFTPARTLPLVWGITLQQIGAVNEMLARPEDIPEGSFVYICNSMMRVMPVKSLSGRVFPLDENPPRFISTDQP